MKKPYYGANQMWIVENGNGIKHMFDDYKEAEEFYEENQPQTVKENINACKKESGEKGRRQKGRR